MGFNSGFKGLNKKLMYFYMRNFMVILFYYISVGGNNVFQKEIYNT